MRTLAADGARLQDCAPKTISNKLAFIRRVLAECVQRRLADAEHAAGIYG